MSSVVDDPIPMSGVEAVEAGHEHVELDYEAEEVEAETEEQKEAENNEQGQDENQDENEENVEELEEGEISDEDDEARKERLKPQPTCRFFSKGQCTWGTSCRFLHPGVLDKGNYKMFSDPKPILPGIVEEKLLKPGSKEGDETGPEAESVQTPTIPVPETAWERGLRQAKEMKKRSQMRKETDMEYEEKKEAMSLTQAEIDKENDYYARKASPIREEGTFEDSADDNLSDYNEEYYSTAPVPRHGNNRSQLAPSHHHRPRTAPPPPPDFYKQHQQPHQPPPRRPSPHHQTSGRRKIAPQRSPPPPLSRNRERGRGGGGGGGGESWDDPWMRRGPGAARQQPTPPTTTNRGTSGNRKRSYSSASSRSSSRSSSSRSRSRSRERRKRPQGRTSGGGRGGRRRSSSSSSGSSSRSRSRSSSPDDIPRRWSRRGGPGGRPFIKKERRSPSPPSAHHRFGTSSAATGANAAPLQKRLTGLGSTFANRPIKKEPEDSPAKRALPPPKRRRSPSSSSSRSRSPSPPPSKASRSAKPTTSSGNPNKPVVPQIVSLDHPGKVEKKQAVSAGKQQIKLTLKSSTSAKPVNKTVLEKLGVSNEDIDNSAASAAGGVTKRRRTSDDSKSSALGSAAKKSGKDKKKDKKTAADRREELLKQLKAVENAIKKKRTKIDD